MLTRVTVRHSWDDRESLLVHRREAELVVFRRGWSFTERRWAPSRVEGRMSAEPPKDSVKECLTRAISDMVALYEEPRWQAWAHSWLSGQDRS